MSHGADWLPLAANAGLSWVSAAVWGGGKWVFVGDRENRFPFFFWFVCLFVRSEGRRSFAALNSSVGGEDTDSRWFAGSWSMALCVFEFALQAQQRLIHMDILCFQLCPCCLCFVCCCVGRCFTSRVALTCSICTLKCKCAPFALSDFLLLCFTKYNRPYRMLHDCLKAAIHCTKAAQ